MAKKISQLTPKVLPINGDVIPINNQGTTKKTSVFNLKNNPFARMYSETGELPEPADLYFDNVSLLLHGDGANNAQNNTFLDSTSINTITRNGTPTQGTFSPFALNKVAYNPSLHGGSGYFNGSTDYLSTTNIIPHTNSQWTIECWFNSSNLSINNTILGRPDLMELAITSTALTFSWRDGIGLNGWGGFTTSFTFQPNTWYHVAVSRNGSTFLCFINGNQITISNTAYNGAPLGSAGLLIGANLFYGNRYFTGYISNLRITSTLVYTSNFTPSTIPLTNIANTLLLLNFTNGGIIDHSKNNNLETLGSAKIITSASKYGGASMSFSVNGDLIRSSDTPALALSKTFTVECWLYRTSSSVGVGVLLDVRRRTNEVGYIAIENDKIKVTLTSPTALLYSASTIALNTWTHVAFVSDSNGSRIYINGTQDATTPTVSDWLGVNRPLYIGNAYHYTSPSTPYYGYIDDYRITKGVARYTSNFTPPTRALPDVPLIVSPSLDPYWDNTTLLLHGDSISNGSDSFIDSSSGNSTITRVGTVTQRSLSPFSIGGGSAYFDGNGTTNHLTAPINAFNFGANDFTIEFWVNPTLQASYGAGRDFTILGGEYSGSGVLWNVGVTGYGSYRGLTFSYGQAGSFTVGIHTNNWLVANQWQHVAITRQGVIWRIFVNGVSQTLTIYNEGGTWNQAFNFNNTTVTTSKIGSKGDTNPFYLSNVRFVKGNPLYTTTFTPSSVPLTNVTNTSLLLNFTNGANNNALIDSSSNNFTITRNGSVTQGSFSPFALNGVVYNPSVHGGSAYFPGVNGNYLSAPSNAAFNFASGTFTVEAWVMFTSTAATQQFIAGNYNSTTTGWHLQSYYNKFIGGFAGDGTHLQGTTTIVPNVWYHVAISGSTGSYKLFVNGTQEGATYTGATSLAGGNLGIGAVGDRIGYIGLYPVTGFISNTRIVNGTALYTSNFTPPTSPATAVAGTSLLCNFTNGGIIDNTKKNILTTVGTAKVSTSVVKYGTGAMYFDGTGDYLTVPASNDFNFANGTPFTVEFWMNPLDYGSGTGFNGGRTIISTGKVFNAGWRIEFGTSIYFYTYNQGFLLSTPISLNTWTHIAVVHDGTNTTMYKNGISIGSTTSATWSASVSELVIGAIMSGSFTYFYNGYIDDLRITKGVARYVSNFTPPTQALPDVFGTTAQQVYQPGDLREINLTGIGKWYGGALATNGKIYTAPFSSDSVLIVNPTSNTATTTNFGLTLTGSSKWGGNVLAPNGKIYAMPVASTSVLIIDPTTNTASTFGSLGAGNKWSGGVLASNGKIYGIPYSSSSVLIIDPVTNTTSTFGSLTGNLKWAGGVLAGNGKIYGIPYDNTSVLIIDPVTNTTSTLGSLVGSGKWQGGVLAPNGKIYGIPVTPGSILVIDPASNSVTTTTFGLSLTGSLKWVGGVLGTNGKIYGIPHSSSSVLIIDPGTNTATTTSFGLSLTDPEKWVGGVLGTNGKVYGIPYSSTSVLQITPAINSSVNIPTERCISAHYNKF